MLRPQIAITSAHQFLSHIVTDNPANRAVGLSAGLGAVLFQSPYGPAFFKGGHDDWTGNMAVCVEKRRRCTLLLSNSVRAETIYPSLVESLLGDTRLPWHWEYNIESPPPPRTG